MLVWVVSAPCSIPEFLAETGKLSAAKNIRNLGLGNSLVLDPVYFSRLMIINDVKNYGMTQSRLEVLSYLSYN